MKALSLSAVVPNCNNAATVSAVLDSVRKQGLADAQIRVVDDASTDESPAMIRQIGILLLTMEANAGRGAVRARAIEDCPTELQLSCDATNGLDGAFLEYALPWFDDPQVAAVFGRLLDPQPCGIAGRWRARHLFLQGQSAAMNQRASLCTWAYVGRVDAIRQVGNFREELRHSEDVELGQRLLDAGYKVVYEPACIARPLVQNTLAQCLERHWRWYAARSGRMNLATLRKWIGLAWRSMVIKDLKANDPLAALVSLALPFHHAYRSLTAS